MGDDAAVVRARPWSATSIDTMVEGVHFRLGEGWATPAEVGHRALAAALSDLAAMGAEPGEAYISLGLPEGFSEEQALALVAGADMLALRSGTAIAGGDVVSSPVLSVSVTVTGWAERRGAADRPRRGAAGRSGRRHRRRSGRPPPRWRCWRGAHREARRSSPRCGARAGPSRG